MDVALIQWPSDESLRIQLARQEHPRLLLVEPEAAPPRCVDVLEDWVRLPVSQADRKARIISLEERACRDREEAPIIGQDGTLDYRGARVQLSGTQARIISALIDRFGAVVSREEVTARAWPGSDASANNLDVTIGRLRREIAGLGLWVKTVRSRGFLLCGVEGPGQA